MPAKRNRPKRDCFNRNTSLPFQLRLEDFEIGMQDVYDLFYEERVPELTIDTDLKANIGTQRES
jgi:hypothetical protein